MDPVLDTSSEEDAVVIEEVVESVLESEQNPKTETSNAATEYIDYMLSHPDRPKNLHKKKKKNNKNKKKNTSEQNTKKQENPTPIKELSESEMKRERLKEILKGKLHACKFNRSPLTEESLEKDKRGRVIGIKKKEVHAIPEKKGADLSQIRNIMATVSQNPEKLEELIKATGLSMEQVMALAQQYQQDRDGSPILDNVEEIREIEEVL